MEKPLRLLRVEEKIKSGQFRTALDVLERTYNAKIAMDQVLMAELLLRTEGAERALGLARQVLESEGIGSSVKARASMILALSMIRSNTQGEVLKLLQQAVHLAVAAKDNDLACKAQIELLVAKFDRFGPECLGTLPADAWRNVRSSGDPYLFSLLHCRLGTMEALRGSLDVAQRHVDLAKLGLKGGENPYISCLIANLGANVAILAADPTEAIARARESLESSRLAGDRLNEFAALNNLCYTSITIGALDEAEVYLKLAEPLASRNALMSICVCDSRAQLELLRGDLDACELRVAAMESLCDDSELSSRSYSALEVTTTRIRLLQQRRHFDSALALARQAVNASVARGAVPLIARFSIQCADLLTELDRLNEASEALGVAENAVRRLSVNSIAIRAEFDCIKGKVFSRLGDRDAALRALDRSIRISTAISHMAARERASALKVSAVEPPESVAISSDAAGGKEPSQRTKPLSAILQSLEAVDSFFALANRPELLGAEAFEFLVSLNFPARVTLLAREGNSLVILKEYTASTQSTLAGEPFEIALGADQLREFALRVTPRETLKARSGAFAFGALLQEAVRGEEGRREHLKTHSVLPVDQHSEAYTPLFRSPRMHEVYMQARKAAASELTILLTGATGVGKEVLAREIHRHSHRSKGVFQPIVCAGMPSGLLESQLFGHRKGSFTGAHSDYPGVIRAADGGTVFLDEIGEISHDLQVKLLRFLESKEIHPIGALHPFTVNVRLMAATNADLQQLVQEGKFREDLFYRLNVATFNIPPLRERREEVPGLVQHYLAEYSRQNHKPMPKVSDEALEYLLLYGWPGNVRELRNEMERLAGMVDAGGTIEPSDLKPAILAARKTMPASSDPNELTIRLDQPMPEVVRRLECEMIRRVLKNHPSLESAARVLGLSRKGLFHKRQRLGL